MVTRRHQISGIQARSRPPGLGHGQPFAGFVLVLQQKAQRLLERRILGGGPHRDTPEQAKKRGAMAFVEAPEEGQVVVARMGHMVLAALENGFAPVRQQGLHRRDLILGGSLGPVSGDQIAQYLHQPVGTLPVANMVVCQRVFAPLVNGGHSLDEHLRQVVQDARRLHVDQRNRQGQPLAGFHLQHSGGVQSPGLRREMPDLHIGNAAQRLRSDPVPCQPGPPVQPDFEMRQGRASLLLLERVPGRETGLWIGDKEGFDAGLLLGAQRGVHLLVEPAIEDAADMARGAGQGVESGKLILFPHQFLRWRR